MEGLVDDIVDGLTKENQRETKVRVNGWTLYVLGCPSTTPARASLIRSKRATLDL